MSTDPYLGRHVLYWHTDGTGPWHGVITDPAYDDGGVTKQMIKAWPGEGEFFAPCVYATTPGTLTWREDPDAYDRDLAVRVDDLEHAQAAGATGYGVVAFHSTGSPLSLALSAGTYATLAGGSIQGDSAGLTYDDSTGELLVDEAGVYLVSLSVSQSRLLGLTSTDATAAVFVDDAESVLRARSSLAAIADTRTIMAQAALRLDAGAVLTLRTRTTVGTTVQVQDFLLSLTWLAA